MNLIIVIINCLVKINLNDYNFNFQEFKKNLLNCYKIK